MASGAKKLIPADPDKVMVIRRVTPDILTLSTPFNRFGRIRIGGRATLVRLQTGAVAVFSPVALTETVRKESDALGTVKYLIAPDVEHHIFLEEWHKAYPSAQIIGPDALPAAREKQNYFKLPASVWTPFTPADDAREPDPARTRWRVSEEFDREFAREYVHAHMNKELVFAHRPSRTLIEADLLFNLPATEQYSASTTEKATDGLLTRLFGALQHTRGAAMGQRRFIWYAGSAGDRPAFNASVRRIAQWDFDRIIPCHGDVIEAGGKGIFEKIMQWHLEAKPKAA